MIRDCVIWDEKVHQGWLNPSSVESNYENFYPVKFQNQAIRGFWVNCIYMRSNGRENTFECPKVVSEVTCSRFWGKVCIEKCFRDEALWQSLWAVKKIHKCLWLCQGLLTQIKRVHIRNMATGLLNGLNGPNKDKFIQDPCIPTCHQQPAKFVPI